MKSTCLKLLSLTIFTVLFANSVQAATITVTDTSDILSSGDGKCTLREAIINANKDAATYADCRAGSGTDEIKLTGGQTYLLTIENADSSATSSGTQNSSDSNYATTGSLDIRDDLKISVTDSGDEETATIDGGGAAGLNDRIFDLAGEDIALELKDLTIKGGYYVTSTAASAYGGGILASHPESKLTLDHCTLTDNTVANLYENRSAAVYGGGIYIGSLQTYLTITDSLISDNTAIASSSVSYGAQGGGIHTSAVTEITDSAITGNTATSPESGLAYGGGIYTKGNLNVKNSTVSGNSATSVNSIASGGGVFLIPDDNLTEPFSFSNSTISANTATTGKAGTSANGGGIYVASSLSPLNLMNTILSGNIVTGPDSSTSLGQDCFGTGDSKSYGFNFIATVTTSSNCNFDEEANAGTDITTLTHEELFLDSLKTSGDTKIHALLADSPAINTGKCTNLEGESVNYDQRGESRGSTCDIGAYEYYPMPIADAGKDSTFFLGSSGKIRLVGTASSDPSGGTLTYSWSLIKAPLRSSVTTSSIDSRDSASASLVPDSKGRYVFQLTVTNSSGDSDSDKVTITVR